MGQHSAPSKNKLAIGNMKAVIAVAVSILVVAVLAGGAFLLMRGHTGTISSQEALAEDTPVLTADITGTRIDGDTLTIAVNYKNDSGKNVNVKHGMLSVSAVQNNENLTATGTDTNDGSTGEFTIAPDKAETITYGFKLDDHDNPVRATVADADGKEITNAMLAVE